MELIGINYILIMVGFALLDVLVMIINARVWRRLFEEPPPPFLYALLSLHAIMCLGMAYLHYTLEGV